MRQNKIWKKIVIGLGIVIAIALIAIVVGDFKQGFQIGYEQGKQKVLMTEVGSAEDKGVDEQYSSEEFRHKRRGLLGHQLMQLLPRIDNEKKSRGHVPDDLKSQLKDILDELEIIANYDNNEKSKNMINNFRKKYDL